MGKIFLGVIAFAGLTVGALASQRALYASANGSLGFHVTDGVGRLFQVGTDRSVWQKRLAQEPDWAMVTNAGMVVTFHERNPNGMIIYRGDGTVAGRIAASDILATLGKRPEGKWWTGLDLRVRTLDKTWEAKDATMAISATATERKHIMSVKWKNQEAFIDLFESRMITAKEISYAATTGATGAVRVAG